MPNMATLVFNDTTLVPEGSILMPDGAKFYTDGVISIPGRATLVLIKHF
jgi:hypothetical protein